MSALGSLANALLEASRVADLNMHVGSYPISGSDVRFGSEAAGHGPASGVAAIVRSGTHWVAAISISVRVRRSYSAKNRRSYLQNLAGTARGRSSFRRIYF